MAEPTPETSAAIEAERQGLRAFSKTFPFFQLMGFELVDVEPGRARLAMSWFHNIDYANFRRRQRPVYPRPSLALPQIRPIHLWKNHGRIAASLLWRKLHGSLRYALRIFRKMGD